MNLVTEQEFLFGRLTEIFYKSNEGVALLGIDNYFDGIFKVLSVTNQLRKVKYIADFDGSPFIGRQVQNYPIVNLNSVDLNNIDTVIVLPKVNNYRIANSLRQTFKSVPKEIKVAGLFSDYTDEDYREYVEYCEKAVLKSKEDFVDFNPTDFERRENDTKVIAYYLPQFHQMEINNKFHGQGFTEWTNTSRAIPLFAGHYQPHIPYDVGYYDLKNPDAMKRQIYLAKHYGVYGFCFYYYWFSGQKVMEEPLKMLYEHTEWNMPFCLMWANENWTSKWDGGNSEIILEQKLADDDDEKFMADVIPYMKDERYIKIDGKPVLVIYKCTMFDKEIFCLMINNFRKIAKKHGFPDLFLMVTNYRLKEDARNFNADSLVEYQPHGLSEILPQIRPKGYLNPDFQGQIFETNLYITRKIYLQSHATRGGRLVRSALTQWDNTARKSTTGSWIYPQLTPQTYKTWLKDIILESKQIHLGMRDMDMVFVNSWNEWAEGSHLEPDCRYGYAYLQATRDALEETRY